MELINVEQLTETKNQYNYTMEFSSLYYSALIWARFNVTEVMVLTKENQLYDIWETDLVRNDEARSWHFRCKYIGETIKFVIDCDNRLFRITCSKYLISDILDKFKLET